jgi:hypothetical protein
MTVLTYSDSIHVACSPQVLYDLVSDVARMGEWSPICKACWWDEGDGPRVGAWFTGRNEEPNRIWETRSQITAADPGREFGWQVGGSWVRWTYTFQADGDGTRLTESWQVLPAGIERFRQNYGDQAETQLAQRSAAALDGIPVTLAAIKAAAETVTGPR